MAVGSKPLAADRLAINGAQPAIARGIRAQTTAGQQREAVFVPDGRTEIKKRAGRGQLVGPGRVGGR